MHPHWLVRLGLRVLVKPLRRNDYAAAQKVDYFIANSTHSQKQIQKYYDRTSTVIFPPVDTVTFSSLADQRHQSRDKRELRCIVWGRHVPYKRLDLAIRACNKLGIPLTVIGSGPETAALKKLAGPKITFTGRISQNQLQQHILDANVFLFPAEEDFGIAPIEALSAGLPVIAYKAGGALDYVKDGVNGVFFERQTVGSLISALNRYQSLQLKMSSVSKSADIFSQQRFTDAMSTYITTLSKESQL